MKNRTSWCIPGSGSATSDERRPQRGRHVQASARALEHPLHQVSDLMVRERDRCQLRFAVARHIDLVGERFAICLFVSRATPGHTKDTSRNGVGLLVVGEWRRAGATGFFTYQEILCRGAESMHNRIARTPSVMATGGVLCLLATWPDTATPSPRPRRTGRRRESLRWSAHRGQSCR